MKANSYNRKLEKYIYDKISNFTGEPVIETLYGSNGKNRIHIPGHIVRGYEHVLYVAKMLYEFKYNEKPTHYNKLLSKQEYDRLIQIINHIFDTTNFN